MEEERAAAIESMRQEIADFVIDASEKVIGRSLDGQEGSRVGEGAGGIL